MRSTQEWEDVLEGTTEGSWKWSSHRVPTLYGTIPSSTSDYEFQVDVLDAEHGGGCGCRSACELELHVSEADKGLIALAPEAVAEVVRLRRELEALREFIDDRANGLRGVGEYVASMGHSEIAARITRILEGTHE